MFPGEKTYCLIRKILQPVMENTNSCSQCNEPVSIIKHLYLGNDDTELLCDLCYTQCHGVAPSSDLMKISDNNNEELSNQVSCLEYLLSLDKNNVSPHIQYVSSTLSR